MKGAKADDGMAGRRVADVAGVEGHSLFGGLADGDKRYDIGAFQQGLTT
ncbi:hypothetical protein ACVWW6_002780 [Bradyrhizobium sp. USDA 3311]|nr:hypothetical protein [Bradyrhizobium sp. Arg816]MDI3566900.1 hypothetical protein [Bradyrhizobium sp. Arg816]